MLIIAVNSNLNFWFYRLAVCEKGIVTVKNCVKVPFEEYFVADNPNSTVTR